MCTKQVVKMTTQPSSGKCNMQTVKDERLLVNKIYFLNKSRTKYLVVGLSTSLQFQPVIQIHSMKSRHKVSFTEQEWLSFWTKEGIFANYLTFQNSFPDAMWEGGKSYAFERLNQEVVLKISDVSCAEEIYIGKESFWKLQEVRALVSIVLEEFKRFNFLKTFEDVVKSSTEGHGPINVGKVLLSLEYKKGTIPFLLYYAMKEFILCYPDLMEKYGYYTFERSE